MTKVLILGSSGMLGSMVLDYLSNKDLDITAPSRKEAEGILVDKYDYIINCIGIIKQKLTDPEEAMKINSLFPYELKRQAPQAKIIQIATDCVYSGSKGSYIETDIHDAIDIYGKTKSLGEVKDAHFYNIRTSIIGFDKKNVSLLSWFLSQIEVKGYTNHYWNGITTLHFAKLCYAIIKNDIDMPNLIHFIPSDVVNKYYLLKIFSRMFNKQEIKVLADSWHDRIDRTLMTNQPKLNKRLWKAMGYENPPTIKQMVQELADYTSYISHPLL